MTQPTTVEKLAEGLSAAQKRAILSGRQPDGRGKWPARNALIDKGLAHSYPWRLTELGRSVRAHLTKSEPTS